MSAKRTDDVATGVPMTVWRSVQETPSTLSHTSIAPARTRTRSSSPSPLTSRMRSSAALIPPTIGAPLMAMSRLAAKPVTHSEVPQVPSPRPGQ